MNITPINFINNLQYIVKGEAGLFIALGLIALSTIVLNRIFDNKKQ